MCSHSTGIISMNLEKTRASRISCLPLDLDGAAWYYRVVAQSIWRVQATFGCEGRRSRKHTMSELPTQKMVHARPYGVSVAILYKFIVAKYFSSISWNGSTHNNFEYVNAKNLRFSSNQQLYEYVVVDYDTRILELAVLVYPLRAVILIYSLTLLLHLGSVVLAFI